MSHGHAAAPVLYRVEISILADRKKMRIMQKHWGLFFFFFSPPWQSGIQPGQVTSPHILVTHSHTGVHVFRLWEESGEHTNATWPYHMTMRWRWCDLWSMTSKTEPVYLRGHVEREENPFVSSRTHRQTVNMTSDLSPLVKLQRFMPKLFICFHLRTHGTGSEMEGGEK